MEARATEAPEAPAEAVPRITGGWCACGKCRQMPTEVESHTQQAAASLHAPLPLHSSAPQLEGGGEVELVEEPASCGVVVLLDVDHERDFPNMLYFPPAELSLELFLPHQRSQGPERGTG
ncbi:unnamed protein product [Gadus morhua 'NCC']